MKKRTLLAPIVALIGAGLLGINPMEDTIRVFNARQVEPLKEADPVRPEQFARVVEISPIPVTEDYGIYRRLSIGGNPRIRQRAWCSAGSGGFNKVRHGRSVRRKHRRA